MSTTVHLPPDLLHSVDHRARDLGMSRNRYIIRALRQALDQENSWSPRLVQELSDAREDREARDAAVEMIADISARRSSKGPPTL